MTEPVAVPEVAPTYTVPSMGEAVTLLMVLLTKETLMGQLLVP